ncbi:5-oxoprolinase subunit PxpA [Shewanella sp. GXUN23E]|uniref:5-oxoprolinase subunit PxpA n=1 Tax=Shewanella sp. GXUN23E TaxID=3422498 RepID=UPI003D7D63E0
MTTGVTLNCDMGESFGQWPMGLDREVMPHIQQANIACGFHASDPDVMAATVQLAQQHNVSIGAHPGYADLQGFGRRHIPHSSEQISHLIAYQTGALMGIAAQFGARVDYVKPHGALYNLMMQDVAVFNAILRAVARLPGHLSLMILSRADNSQYRALASAAGVPLLLEAFADRAYTRDGLLMPRSESGAVLDSEAAILSQTQLLAGGAVNTCDGSLLPLEVDSICVHGDNPASVNTIAAIAAQLASQ